MSIRFDKVTIRISELQTTTVTVAPWETPVLQAIYGEEAEVTGSEEVDRAAPEANDEFARLAVRYGPKNAETPVVAAVYGSFGPGVAKLASEIKRSTSGVVSRLEAADALEVPQLTDEQIDAIAAQGDIAQSKVSPADDSVADLV